MSFSIGGYRFPRVPLALVGVVIGFCAFASTSQAACSYPEAEQVFAPWQDTGYYQLAPDGGLEGGGTGWTLEGGAALVPGNETQFLNGEEDDTSLSLPFGGTATSPPFCVDPSTPVFRLMAMNSGKKDTKLRVSVIYEQSKRNEIKATDVQAAPDWAPTEALKLETRNGEERVARVSFTSKDPRGVWAVDDLYVDPFARR